jgi:DNA polymerase IIIc chi subunit
MNYRSSIKAGFFLFFFCTCSVFAQDYAFKVLASKGNNTIDGQAVKVGAKISDNQTIKVSEGAYLSLAHHSGKAIEVAAGSYKAKDLSSKIGQNTSMTSKYAKFVVNELTQDEQSVAAARNRFQHMNKTGSVERDLTVSSVRVWLPLNSMIIGEQLLLKWSDAKADDPSTAYQVQISDLSDQVLFSSQTKERQLLVNLTAEQLAGQPHLIVKVLPVDAASGKLKVAPEQIDGSILIKPEGTALTELSKELADIRKEFGNTSAIGKLAEANFFEEKGLIADAVAAYETAIKISGNAPQYQELYTAFLVRNAFQTINTANLNK